MRTAADGLAATRCGSSTARIQRCAPVIDAAPLITDHLDAESRAHFDALCAHLDAAGIEYRINPRLVRGLDYYTRTVFEWVTDALGAQDAVCSGGRYDGLFAQLGGEPTPAIGWAMGQERVVALMAQAHALPAQAPPHIFLVVVGERAESAALRLAEQLRDAHSGLRIHTNIGGGNFKAQFRRADRSGAQVASSWVRTKCSAVSWRSNHCDPRAHRCSARRMRWRRASANGYRNWTEACL